jgi:methionyl-tRNA formyltransferase
MDTPRITFMGTPEFAVPSLDYLLKNRYNVTAVVTVPDKPQGRGLKLESSEVKKYALKNNLNILQAEKLKDESFISTIKVLEPDLIIIVAFKILPKEVYSLAKLGAFNLHASLLPKYRGAAPINWAIINGEKKTGVTTFFLEEKVDTGNLILQKEISIGENETAGELHDRLSILGAELVLQSVKLIMRGNVKTKIQDNSFASPAPKIHKEDCQINWKKDTVTIHNFIRGLSPFPGAFTKYKDKILKIFKSEIIRETGKINPGEITIYKDYIIVSTINGGIKVLEVQIEGKRKMNIYEFLRGHRLQTGEIFT